MQTLTVTTDTAADANFLASFLRTVKLVKEVVVEKQPSVEMRVKEPTEKYNWVNPSRPATDDEIEQMLDECEEGTAISAEESRKNNLKKFKAWKQKSLK